MRGVFTALITPFNDQEEIDIEAFRRIVRDQVGAGVAGVIPCGTTGESPTLSSEEKKLLIRTCLEEAKGTSLKVIAGTGSNNTRDSIELSRWASDQGVHGVLIVTPYYNKPSQEGLKAHFLAVAEAVRCEVVLYNVPGRTGVSLSAATVAELAKSPRITTIKEASGNVALTCEILDQLSLHGRKMEILSGDDATYLALLSSGASGVISVASNLFPRAMVSLQKSFDAGDHAEAKRIHEKYYPLFRDLFVESNPVPIKFAMAHAGWCDSRVRLPLVPLSKASVETLLSSLKRCEIRKGAQL